MSYDLKKPRNIILYEVSKCGEELVSKEMKSGI